MEDKIIGRVPEKKLLKELAESSKSEFIAVYGRRRVGKTFLIKEMFHDKLSFNFTGIYSETKNVQLYQFGKALSKYFGKEHSHIENWYEAFDILEESLLELNHETVYVFLDELPWMDTRKSDFLGALSCFWNNWDSERVVLKLFVCGSSTTWMIDKLIGNKGGLYGRITRSIYLAPFNLSETSEYLKICKNMELSHLQILDIYMILGGIPYYLDMLDGREPIEKNIDRLFFYSNAPLKNEFEFLFRSLFNDSVLYRNIVKTLSTKMSGMTRKELIEKTHVADNGVFSTALKNLVSCEFVQKSTVIGKKEHDAIYRLFDPFSIFYLRFASVQTGTDEHYWSNMAFSGEINAWKGMAFENVCMHHIPQIKKALGISGIMANTYSWSVRSFEDSDGTQWLGGQIDLLIDRRDNVIDIVEIKYSASEYVITADYAETLRKRAELFRHVTKTKKALHPIFITTYGIKKNSHSGIAQNEILLDNLFD